MFSFRSTDSRFYIRSISGRPGYRQPAAAKVACEKIAPHVVRSHGAGMFYARESPFRVSTGSIAEVPMPSPPTDRRRAQMSVQELRHHLRDADEQLFHFERALAHAA